MIFENREHAARLLAQRLMRYKGKHPLVLGIPRGAIPMAEIIANALEGDVDAVLVRKLGYPGKPELAIGAVDESGAAILADYASEVDPAYIETEKTAQLKLIRRRRARYTPSRAPIDPGGRFVILVDDGIATGATMTAALRAVQARKPKQLVGAVAVASRQAARVIADECDAMECLTVPAEFFSVGQFFKDFAQVSDDDVVALLQLAEKKASAHG